MKRFAPREAQSGKGTKGDQLGGGLGPGDEPGPVGQSLERLHLVSTTTPCCFTGVGSCLLLGAQSQLGAPRQAFG